MATADMTDASGARDPAEAQRPGDRGWFQPPGRPSAADVESAQNGPGDDEPPTATQAPLARSVDRQAPDHPAPDITRPELILDDAVIDIAGSRGGRNLSQTGAADG